MKMSTEKRKELDRLLSYLKANGKNLPAINQVAMLCLCIWFIAMRAEIERRRRKSDEVAAPPPVAVAEGI